MRVADQILQQRYGVGLRDWFLLDEHVELNADEFAARLGEALGRSISSATLYHWWPRLALERRTRLIDLEAEAQTAG